MRGAGTLYRAERRLQLPSGTSGAPSALAGTGAWQPAKGRAGNSRGPRGPVHGDEPAVPRRTRVPGGEREGQLRATQGAMVRTRRRMERAAGVAAKENPLPSRGVAG